MTLDARERVVEAFKTAGASIETTGRESFNETVASAIESLLGSTDYPVLAAEGTTVRNPFLPYGVVTRYGATGAGVVDERAAFFAADAAGNEKIVPAGTYRISSNLTLNGTWRFARGALLVPDAGVTVTLSQTGRIFFSNAWLNLLASGSAFVAENGSTQDGALASSGPSDPSVVVRGYAGNKAAGDIGAVTIGGGGAIANPQLVGFQEFRDRYNGDGVTSQWDTTFDVTAAANVRVRLIRTDKVRVTVTSFCTVTIVGGKARVVYPQVGHFVNNATGGAEGTDPVLLTTEQIEIVGVETVEVVGSGCNYSGVYGGYDNIISAGVMCHILGAHHRITGTGDHNTIFGGSYARIDAGSYGIILGGTANEITVTATGSVIIGGNGCTVDTLGPGGIFASSGSRCRAAFAVIFGGATNDNSGNGAAVTGRSNTNSARDALVAGFGNVVSGVYNFCAGLANTVLGSYASAIGRDNTATAEASFALGRKANARLIGGLTIGGNMFATLGDAQTTMVPIRRQTTSASVLVMLADSSSLTVPANTTWAFRCLIAARRVDGGGSESAAYDIVGAIKNNAGTTALLGTPTLTVLGEDDATWNVAATANDTNDTLEIRVTGAAGKTINWSGRLGLAEVTG